MDVIDEVSVEDFEEAAYVFIGLVGKLAGLEPRGPWVAESSYFSQRSSMSAAVNFLWINNSLGVEISLAISLLMSNLDAPLSNNTISLFSPHPP